MSLKARIEAVIYAAEEPVTLAQLVSLFREEALALRVSRIAPTADASEADASEPEEVVDELLSSTFTKARHLGPRKTELQSLNPSNRNRRTTRRRKLPAKVTAKPAKKSAPSSTS
jgi:hypothetical protein